MSLGLCLLGPSNPTTSPIDLPEAVLQGFQQGISDRPLEQKRNVQFGAIGPLLHTSRSGSTPGHAAQFCRVLLDTP